VRALTRLLAQALQRGIWQARATRKCPDSRALSNQEAAGHRRLNRSRGRSAIAGRSSVNPALTGQARGRARLHRASLSGSARRKVAARATRKCPDSRTLSNHEAAGYRRFDKSRGRATVAGMSIGEAPTHQPGAESCTSSQGFSLRACTAESGGARNAQIP
jgi:hypothetical protein